MTVAVLYHVSLSSALDTAWIVRVLELFALSSCCLVYEWASYFMSERRVSEPILEVCGGCDSFSGKASYPQRHSRGDLCKQKRKSC